MNTVGIAMGSNLGNKLLNLQLARKKLQAKLPSKSIILSAPVFSTPPIHCPPDSPDFYNTVLEFNYPASPEQLLQLTQEIETAMGRKSKGPEHLPRVIDLDILYFGQCFVQTKDLTIPHPRMSSRRFVLEPLSCINPNLILPGQSYSIQTLLHTSPEPELKRITEEW